MKQTISIIVVVVALAGAGIFGYMALSKSGVNIPAAVPTSGSGGQILPMGATLNFNNVQKFNKDNRLFPYPVVNQSDIGVATGDMIKQ